MESSYLTESERQAELVRLRREKRKTEKEDDFEKAALLLGLAERQQAEATDKWVHLGNSSHITYCPAGTPD